MAQLPIRKLTLYKQGIGYFERQGIVQGTTISLVVPREATNDVLKSLSVSVVRGGQLLSIDYDTPEDKDKLLNELSVKLNSRSSMVDLLASLRGSQVSLHLDDGLSVGGRVVGVEHSLGEQAQVLLQSDALNMQTWQVARVRGLTLHDERAATDVSFFLDISRMEQTRTALTVRLAGEEHDVQMVYLAPSPTWRVSYRLIAGADGKAQLFGWGVFENSLDEDLENVALTLKSGRPISFEYGLYESRTPSRPEVSDDPSSLESIAGNPMLVESIGSLAHDLRSPLSTITGYAELLAMEGLSSKQREMLRAMQSSVQRLNDTLDNLMQLARVGEHGSDFASGAGFYRAGLLGDLKVSGSYFMPVLMSNAEAEFLTYNVQTPVSVRRGQSAIVPIINARVDCEPLCVYNHTKMPNHPLLVWRLFNTTGTALEQGPVTVTQDGQYLGDGLIRFAGVGDELQIPYALEFGILVKQDSRSLPIVLREVRFDANTRQASVFYYDQQEEMYTLTSRVNRDLSIHIERRDTPNSEYYDMPQPVVAVQGHTRWLVSVPAHQEVTFTVRERRSTYTSEDPAKWQPKRVEDLRGVLTENVYALFTQLFAERQQAAQAVEQIKALQAEYDQVVSRQEQLRKNLSTLGDSEREIAIRDRVLDDLEVSENRRRALESEIANLNADVKQRQTNQTELINQLFAAEA